MSFLTKIVGSIGKSKVAEKTGSALVHTKIGKKIAENIAESSLGRKLVESKISQPINPETLAGINLGELLKTYNGVETRKLNRRPKG